MTKQDAIALIDSLPDDVTWHDILYEVYVRIELEAGLADIEAGRTVSNNEVMEKIKQWRRHVPSEPQSNA